MTQHVPMAVDGLPDGERLSPDDLAALRAEQQRDAALAAVRQAAAAPRQRAAGVCANCGARCLPLALYCDDDCKHDHERRQGILRRQGRTA